MKYLSLILFLCLPVWASRELAAQNRHENQQEIAGKYYRLNGPKMSEDGKWLTIRKTYELNNDTVLIFSIRYPEKPVGYRTKVGSIIFSDKDHLLLHYPDQAELLNLKEKTSIHFKGVKKILELKNNKQFLLHYNEEEKNKLELHYANGHLLNVVDNVCRFYTTVSGHIYAITEKEESEFEVILLKDKTKEKVYETSQKISYLEIDPEEQGVMVYEQVSESPFQEILYLYLKTKTGYPLKEVLPIAVERGFREVVREGSSYFLRLEVHQEKEDSSLVDIWYGNDHQLEEKFYPPIREVHYLWEPEKKQIQRIGSDELKNNVNIGNDRYFISYNPYQLKDYTKSTKFRIMIYDRLKNLYTLMDTIPRELHVSPDGQCVLYPKNNTWHIYQMATGTIKVLGDKNLQTPYFTGDKKIILFTGVDGLWQYDAEKNRLLKMRDFEEAEVTILNNSVKYIPGADNFFQKTVEHTKPLVIRLYNSSKNENTYLLWNNGMYETIIPPTKTHIQDLNYDDAYEHFIYIVEDYNMPPRLEYKEMAKEKEVVYQSNKADKAILSLRQEIVSYTNSDGIPLKGILYYPLYYTPFQRFPMVVHIYEKQNHLSNLYPYPSYYEGLGFNIRLLIEMGYFVYLPDILIQGKEGPGMDALDCVNNALNALAGNPLIDKHKIGLIGHSFGGYETDFIATHSDRFAAYVSGSGISDLIHMYNSFNYNFIWPDYKRVETGQFRMGISFTENKIRYLNNNPVYYAEKVNAPILLWAGMEDRNATSDHSMAFYNAISRNKKSVIALFYKGEGHSLRQKQKQIDLTSRVLDWFDYFLRNDTGIEWIGKGLK